MKFYVILGVLLFVFVAGAALGYFYSQHSIPGIISDQQTTDKKNCEQAQTITKGSNNALSENAISVAAKLDAGKLRHPNTCVSVARSAAVPAGGAKHARPDGSTISTDWLRNFAAQCETYRGEVGVCVDFLAQERQLVDQQ